jgi:hypothetical protein
VNPDKFKRDEAPMREIPFYVVWNSNMKPQNQPMVRHDTYEEAAQEAERLARLRPQDTFYILKALAAGKAEPMPVKWQTL